MNTNKQLNLNICFNKERVVFLNTSEKTNAINSLLEKLQTCEAITDYEMVKQEMLQREELVSTNTEAGVAVPHVRSRYVNRLSVSIGISDKDIIWDKKEKNHVRIVIMIVTPTTAHREYLSLLQKISTLLKNDDNVKKLKSLKDPEQIYNMFIN